LYGRQLADGFLYRFDRLHNPCHWHLSCHWRCLDAGHTRLALNQSCTLVYDHFTILLIRRMLPCTLASFRIEKVQCAIIGFTANVWRLEVKKLDSLND
jgi:hypothetical protein